jgi:hypothetical protein
MRVLGQFFRRRPFLGGLVIAAALYLIGSGWIITICGLAVWWLVNLAWEWIKYTVFERPLRSLFDRYPAVGEVLCILFVAAIAALAALHVYSAWASGTIYDKGHILTFDSNPIAFTISVGVSLLLLLVGFAFSAFLAWGYREDRLSDQRFRNRPPLDQAIRRSIDER